MIVESRKLAYRFILFPVVLFVGVAVIPIFYVFRDSLYSISRTTGPDTFVGLRNFTSLFSDQVFWKVLQNTAIWTLSMVIITTISSMVVALLLNGKFFGVTVARTLVMLPWTIPPAIYAIIWRFIYNGHFGALNNLLLSLNIIDEPVFWLSTPSYALPSVIWVGVLNSIPFTVLVLLGGLSSIPEELYEAASIDGCGGWSKFWHITLPLLKSTLEVITIFNVILIFRNFPIVWGLTEGGPLHSTEIISTYIYKTAFRALDWGSASALSVVAFAILVVFVIIFSNLIKGGKNESI